MFYKSLFSLVFSVFVLSEPAFSQDDFLKSSEFLTWKETTQDFYIRASIGMAGFITSRNKKSQADCLENWYFQNIKNGNGKITKAMKQFPDYHPRAVLLAVVEKQCGKLIF